MYYKMYRIHSDEKEMPFIMHKADEDEIKEYVTKYVNNYTTHKNGTINMIEIEPKLTGALITVSMTVSSVLGCMMTIHMTNITEQEYIELLLD